MSEINLIFFLHVDFLKNQEQSSRSCSPDEMSETTVDIKKFITFLHGHQVSPSKVICSEYTYYLDAI